MTRLAAALCSFLFAAPVFPAELEISNGWVRLLPAGVPAAGYFELRNSGGTGAELVGASSPAFGQAMLHRSAEDEGRSTMMHVRHVEVPAGGKIVFKPGGYHVMLTKPTRALRIGDKVPLTLEFGSGAKVTAQFDVRGPAGR